MNKCKCLILALAASCLLFPFADLSAQPGIGVGYLNSVIRMRPQEGGKAESSVPLDGFSAGASDDIRLAGNLYLQPGLYYSYLTDNGRASSVDIAGLNIKSTLTEHHFNVPVHLKYSFEIINDILGVYLSGGPTVTFGVASNSYCELAGAGVEANASANFDHYSGKVSFENVPEDIEDLVNSHLPSDRYHRFDVMMGAAVGIEVINLIELKIGYDWGLLNRAKGSLADEYSIRRNQFTLALGLRF